MKHNYRKVQFAFTALVIVLLLGACEDDVNIPEGAFDEQIVDLRGEWSISSVVQNEDDISGRMDFGTLRLTLNMTEAGPSDYEVETNGLPFITLKDGTWSYNDLTYPTSITFTSPDGDVVASFATPPVSGGNYFEIAFSLGCEDNVYIYRMQKQ